MHPDDELKKRLRERFASYEPEPETSWQQFEGRLSPPSKPVHRKKRTAVAIVFLLLMVTGVGFWINRQFHAGNLKTSSKVMVEKQVVSSRPRQTEAISVSQQPDVNSTEIRSSQRTYIHPKEQIAKASHLSNLKNSIGSGISHDDDEINSSLSGQDPAKSKFISATDSSLLSADLNDNILGNIQPLNARQISYLSVGLLPPHLPIQSASNEYVKTEAAHASHAWVVKGGPFLGYSVMNSKVRESNSAVQLENLRTSLPQRLGWDLYIGRQQSFSRGRQLEIGAVLRQFGQAIRYQVPNGEYSVAVQPDRSMIVTQLRDTLTDRSNHIQAGLRLGYSAPISLFSGLHWGVGGEAVYQFNLRRTVMNAEVTLGKTLTGKRSTTFLIELFANTAVRPAYDSYMWVRVLPYRVGLRIGLH